jgi:hypothetical protein
VLRAVDAVVEELIPVNPVTGVEEVHLSDHGSGRPLVERLPDVGGDVAGVD